MVLTPITQVMTTNKIPDTDREKEEKKDSIDIYCGGNLFDTSNLTRNRLLQKAIEGESKGRYKLVLPQDLEGESMEAGQSRGHQIRDNDILALLKCKGMLMNCDGTELDSGTVVEQMYAKMADMPMVQLRTDFRAAGDNPDVNFNLMAAYYPRSEVVDVNAMEAYQKAYKSGAKDPIAAQYQAIAQKVVGGFDKAFSAPPVIPEEDKAAVYRNIINITNFTPDAKKHAEEILSEKLGHDINQKADYSKFPEQPAPSLASTKQEGKKQTAQAAV